MSSSKSFTKISKFALNIEQNNLFPNNRQKDIHSLKIPTETHESVVRPSNSRKQRKRSQLLIKEILES